MEATACQRCGHVGMKVAAVVKGSKFEWRCIDLTACDRRWIKNRKPKRWAGV